MKLPSFIKKVRLLFEPRPKQGFVIEKEDDDVQFFYPGDIALKEAFDKGLIKNIDETIV